MCLYLVKVCGTLCNINADLYCKLHIVRYTDRWTDIREVALTHLQTHMPAYDDVKA